MRSLKNEPDLEKSSIVANSLMNRGRSCRGGNSYQKEISLDIPDYLETLLRSQTKVAWLDLCCGSGKALIEATDFFIKRDLSLRVKITGIDLAGMFASPPAKASFLRFVETSIEKWQSNEKFDLITCVHGLHYVGDKLRVLEKAVARLTKNGLFLANLDLVNFRNADAKPAGRIIAKEIRKRGGEYLSNKHLLIFRGGKEISFGFDYLGGDDAAGANYTGQPVVDSYYANLNVKNR